MKNRRSPSLAAAPVLLPGIVTDAVWVGLGAVARSREIGWRSGKLFLGSIKTSMFSEIHLNITTTAEEQYIRRIKNVSCEIEDFVESRLCKLCGILRSRVLRVLYDLMKDVSPFEGN